MTSTHTGTELYLCSETLAISKMFLIPLEMDQFGSFSQGESFISACSLCRPSLSLQYQLPGLTGMCKPLKKTHMVSKNE